MHYHIYHKLFYDRYNSFIYTYDGTIIVQYVPFLKNPGNGLLLGAPDLEIVVRGARHRITTSLLA